MNKKRKSKRGLSVVIGYVLLVTFGIIMSATVYHYLKTFVPSDIDQCPSDVSIFIQDYSCSANQLNLTLKNNGKFNMQGYFIYASNSSNDSLATINLAKYFDSSLSSGISNNISVYFDKDVHKNFTSGETRYNVFSGLPKAYYSISIIPGRFKKSGSTEKFVSCGNSEITQVLSCNGVTAPPTCSDGIWETNEIGTDCGGVCPKCLNEQLTILSATQNVTTESSHQIENAYDGNLQTRWAASPIPSEITFDFGKVKQVGQTRFLFYKYNESRVYNYSVDVSTDNVSWTQVVSKKSSTPNNFTIDTFTPVSARYVRLNFISQNQNLWAGLYEAEIWSVQGPTNSPAPSCNDKIKNGNETDVDCGGPTCTNKCTTGQGCLQDSDCQSNICGTDLTCAAPPQTLSTDLYGTKTKYSCDYYASPTGTGNGLSESSPFKIVDFWGVAGPGKTLCLMNGTYTGADSMIRVPQGLSGTESNPIRIVALYDGKAFIDGQGVMGPIYLYYNNWFDIEGINILNARQQYEGNINSSTSYVKDSNNIIYRRVVAWESGSGNTDNFATDYSTNITYEDIGSFGQARKMMSGGHRSDNNYDPNLISGNRMRRVWARLQKDDYGGEGGITVGYNTNGNIIENSIVTVNGTLNNLKGEGSSDSFGFFDDRQWDNNNQILGSIAYKTVDEKVWGQEMNSYLYADSQNMTIKDMLIFVEGDNSTFGTNLEATARLNPYHWDNFTGAEYLTFIGGPGVLVAPNTHSKISNIIVTNMTWNPDANVSGGRRVPATGLWSALTGYDPTEYVMAWANHINWNVEPTHNLIQDPDLIGTFGNLLQYGTAPRPTVNGQYVGAQIACRYENGVLTDKPLWPWPMEERIRVATCMYDNGMTLEQCENDKSKGVQVTKTVFELGGGHVPDFESLNPILCPGN